ncbi:MAG: hypothetical protein J6X30_00060 [Clostridia bacterium]|nr:hypothetical protein [Clostridia bacterium]
MRHYDRLLMKLFMKTGDPMYYAARGVLRREEDDGRNDPDAGDRSE